MPYEMKVKILENMDLRNLRRFLTNSIYKNEASDAIKVLHAERFGADTPQKSVNYMLKDLELQAISDKLQRPYKNQILNEASMPGTNYALAILDPLGSQRDICHQLGVNPFKGNGVFSLGLHGGAPARAYISLDRP